MDYSLIEKLAIVKTLDEIILANGEIHEGEKKYLSKLKKELDFNENFVKEARKMRTGNSIQILSQMSDQKKNKFANMMHRMAIADGSLDEREINLIISVYKEAGINVEDPSKLEIGFDLSYVYFESTNHNVYYEGLGGTRSNIKVNRAIKIEPVLFNTDKYSATILNTEGDLTIWKDEIVQKPLILNIENQTDNEIEFINNNGDNEKITLLYSGPDIRKIYFHFIAKNKDVEYLP